jgi:hypothetical protein
MKPKNIGRPSDETGMDQPKHGSEEQVGVDDRRREERHEEHGDLRVFVESSELGGKVENISPAGVYFFSTDQLRVRVEVETNGKTETYHGRMARVARMSDTETGFAIEFDRD